MHISTIVWFGVSVVYQAVLISAGNLSFLNWLTALPAIWCLDDKVSFTSMKAHQRLGRCRRLWPQPITDIYQAS
jgi:hypothetical protein